MSVAHPPHAKDATSFDPTRFYQHIHHVIPPFYRIAARTDIGIRRKSNQDAFLFLPLQDGFLGVICDGMGGYQGGDIASQLAVDAVRYYFEHPPAKARWQPFQALREAIQSANRAIHLEAQKNEKLRQMGSTIVALLVHEEQAYIAHVGDSRLYLLREGTLLQITRDHSAIERMKEQGKSTEKVKSNIITRVLGRLAEVEVECQPLPLHLQEGDRLLLCSDGLTGMMEDQEILEHLARQWDPTLAAERLIETANDRGGKDNISLILIDYAKPKRVFGWGAFFMLLALVGLLFWPVPPHPTTATQPPTPPKEPQVRSVQPPARTRYVVPRALLVPPSQKKKRKRLKKRRVRYKKRKKRRRRKRPSKRRLRK
ncbi:MAG: serine/threonine-protein phosphatase [Myxococcales bacterium]|nr:serine/threonine-protein phosphatase [Myxococcales bacterium]